jgi:hypothetical protein
MEPFVRVTSSCVPPFAATGSTSRSAFIPLFFLLKTRKLLERFLLFSPPSLKAQSAPQLPFRLPILVIIVPQILMGITDDELQVLDAFEDVEYTRTRVEISLTVSIRLTHATSGNINFRDNCSVDTTLVEICFFMPFCFSSLHHLGNAMTAGFNSKLPSFVVLKYLAQK